jgi:NAD(P)-dependent dehydrogenase (short-subunit alcohol dehydrogenase family)
MQKVLGSLAVAPQRPEDLTGRVALVTGSTHGSIGYEIAHAFALAGARVVLVSRKEDAAEEALTAIREAAKKQDPPVEVDIEWLSCDLGNLKQVREVFTGVKEKESRLDLLICSAGINTNAYGTTSDGLDRHWAVNWLSHYYICNLLWPLLRKTSKLGNAPPPRVVFESSEMHRAAPSDVHFASLDEINNPDVGPVGLCAPFGSASRVIC